MACPDKKSQYSINSNTRENISIENFQKQSFKIYLPLSRNFIALMVLVRSSSAESLNLNVRAKITLLQMILYVRVKFPKILVNFTTVLNLNAA